MTEIKFNPKKLEKLNNPNRLKDLPPSKIWKEIQLNHPKILVDVGAGTGFFSIPFAQHVLNGTLYACDISELMIQWMNENIVKTNSNIVPCKMDENNIPLENEIADLVYMFNLYHELHQPIELLKDCFRVLKKGGKLLIADWKKVDMKEGPPLHIRLDPKTVIEQLKQAGASSYKSLPEYSKHFLLIAEK